MPAKSKKQQMAAGAALSAKRGKRRVSSLKGASRSMYKSMSKRSFAVWPRPNEKNCRKRNGAKERQLPYLVDDYQPAQRYDVSPFCMISSTSFRGSVLILFAPVKG